MTVLARISSAGAQTSLQDAGRPGSRHLGVPTSGAADRLSLGIANAAVGNGWDTTALECALTGPTLTFESEAIFALAGADMSATLNGIAVERGLAHSALPGDVLQLGAATKGLRAYIAFAGGLKGNEFLGSASTYGPAKIGGLEGRTLCDGDAIENAGLRGESTAILPAQLFPEPQESVILRATPAPEWALFNNSAHAHFFSSAFIVAARGNRMGVELQGPSLAPPDDFSMISSPVFPGTVQIPASGNPFLLLCDAQTTGGYARIAQIIDADAHLTGQLRPGMNIWFSRVTAETARDITAKKTALYQGWLNGFQFA